MQWINVYDINLNRIGMLLTWISLLWEHCYNTVGSFQLEVQETEENARLLRPWTYFKLNDDDRPMIATSVQLKDKKIVVRGYPASYILQKRVSDIVISDRNAEEAMFEVVDKMTPWDNFYTGSLKGLDDKYKNQFSDGSVLEYCEAIGQDTDMGFHVRKTGKSLYFECYKPEFNPNIKASERYNNLANLIYNVNDNNHYNVAIVAGMAIDNTAIQQYFTDLTLSFDVAFPSTDLSAMYSDSVEGFSVELIDGNLQIVIPDEQYGYVDPRIYNGDLTIKINDRFTVEAGDSEATGYQRREIYIDARDVQLNENDGETMEQYAERLRLRGLQKLAELLRVETVEYDIDDDRAKLGDLISISIPEFGFKAITRIVSDKYKSQNNYLQRTIKVGQPINILALTSLRRITI